ncbi:MULTISPECIES: DUF4230 domain-containing protein [Ornithinibacillus]|uniref:DUF4230 domain-containing protein n=1 Tax=Ornithinibacillus TaxID=484508 RepID=UPI001FE666E0|nr:MULTISPECIES: DUF4230 domain-containing protein [Ornithinibacillus]
MKKKNDEVLKQLENMLDELKKGEDESTATAVVGRRKGRTMFGAFSKLFFRFWGIRILIIVIILAIFIFGGMRFFSGSTLKKETTTYVEQVQDLATLATAQAHLKVVIEQVDNKLFGNEISINFPGTKRELILIVPATVTAGVDLKTLDSDAIKVDEKNKEIKIALPKATLLQDPAIQMDGVRAFSDEGLFRGNVRWDEGFDLAAEAQKEAEEEAIEVGLFDSAEENARKLLEEFFGELGYRASVSFNE